MVGWLCVGFSKIYGNFVMNVELTEKQIFWQKKTATKKKERKKYPDGEKNLLKRLIYLYWGGNEITF